MRLAGRICYSCAALLPPPYAGQERHCETRLPHRVYLSFVDLNRWRCRFHDDDLAKRPASIYDAARRGHGLNTLESGRVLEMVNAAGTRGVRLGLTDEQFASLKGPSNAIKLPRNGMPIGATSSLFRLPCSEQHREVRC